MTECATLLCIYNQMPSIGWDDVFIVGYLVFGVGILIYFVKDAWKDK